MELQEARQIIDTLAQGIHPQTGEAMPEDSPYNAPPVIRALFAVSRALDGGPVRPKRAAPANAGKPWAAQDDQGLLRLFDSGADLKQMAQELGRSRVAVEARLVKFGRLSSREAVPFSAAAAA